MKTLPWWTRACICRKWATHSPTTIIQAKLPRRRRDVARYACWKIAKLLESVGMGFYLNLYLGSVLRVVWTFFFSQTKWNWDDPDKRRKKKEYVKCLENRVEVLETQNRALIDELKTLKDIHCSSTGGSSDGRSTTSPMASLKQELRWFRGRRIPYITRHQKTKHVLAYLSVH